MIWWVMPLIEYVGCIVTKYVYAKMKHDFENIWQAESWYKN